MAILFLDSFDHYGSNLPETLTKWTSGRNPGDEVVLGGGRFGNGWSNGNRRSVKNFTSNYVTMFAGASMQLSAMGGASDAIIGFRDSGSVQVVLCWNGTSQEFQFRRASHAGTTIGPAYRFSRHHLQWYYIEIKVVFNGSTGSVELKIDGVTAISQGSLDTTNTANNYANELCIGSTQDQSSLPHMDDLYVIDDTDTGVSGNPCNTYLGDIRVESLFPNGNGNSSQFTGSDGNNTDNYLLVDETAPNGDTDYVTESTVGEKDTYAYTNLTPTTGTVYVAQILPYARKTEAGVRSIKSIARLSGTEADGPERIVGTSYAYEEDFRHADPAGNQWTVSNINSAEFGVKMFA